ncbi:PAS domain S-box protein [Paraburkholderia madseniana]|uniref:histidine kinase n=2 Tax=Paraburkholderia madseniana TaxID=2599607 RepID=A0A6N6W8M2_9BURK|nr:PAS domain S-box protein [Paraburkholderia madseniana]
MSFVMPAIVILQTAIILGLLVLGLRHRASAAFSSVNPPIAGANSRDRGMPGEHAAHSAHLELADKAALHDSLNQPRQSECQRPEQFLTPPAVFGAPDSGLPASRARRRFTDRLRMMTSARTARRRTHDDVARAVLVHDSHADDDNDEQVSGEHYFREVLALLPLATLMLDGRGVMAMVNPKADRLFGYDRNELPGKPVEMLIHALRFDSHASRWDAPPATQQLCRFLPLDDLCARRKDGTEFRADIDLCAFRFGGENVTLAFVIDKTDRYELRRQREDLAHLTRVSTMGQLASSLAHELNQPLTAILSNVQAAQRFMMADPIDLAELRDILNDIVQDDYRASEVIRRIRAVVKKGGLEVIPLDLAGVMRDVVALVHSDAIVRGTRVTLDIDSTLPPVRGDRVQLQQVMLNLLLNAFDAMNEVPPVDRMVCVTLKPADNGMVLIAVRDRGHGLTADKLDKIFKPFFTSKPQGLGLGLSISRSIIDMHRGRLWAENNNDRGATFYVALPVGDATPEDKSR